jgi:hypothetical protein
MNHCYNTGDGRPLYHFVFVQIATTAALHVVGRNVYLGGPRRLENVDRWSLNGSSARREPLKAAIFDHCPRTHHAYSSFSAKTAAVPEHGSERQACSGRQALGYMRFQ